MRRNRKESESMNYQANTWALVLAAGDGTRLASLTRSRLMQKLGVSNRSSLIRFAIQHAMAP
jgi:hypothetical protein